MKNRLVLTFRTYQPEGSHHQREFPAGLPPSPPGRSGRARDPEPARKTTTGSMAEGGR